MEMGDASGPARGADSAAELPTEGGDGQVTPARARRGRRPIHGSGAARQAAYRERQSDAQEAAEMARAILRNLNVPVVKKMIDQLLAKTADRAAAIEQLQQHLARHAAVVRTS